MDVSLEQGLSHADYAAVAEAMGCSFMRHSRHTMVLVPRDAAGVKVERMLTTMGYGEASFDDVRVPGANVLRNVVAKVELGTCTA